MITVVLPAFNEAEAIPRLLSRLQDALPSFAEPTRVLIVDDGTDSAHRLGTGLRKSLIFRVR
jgi:glycosyltransferase involved in cell wall biosynthesis